MTNRLLLDRLYWPRSGQNSTKIPSRIIHMAIFKFHCPHCQQKISADESQSGISAQCPTCCKVFATPAIKAKSASPKSIIKPAPQANNAGGKAKRSKSSPRFVLLGIGCLVMCAYGLGRLSVSPNSETRENMGKSFDPGLFRH